MPTFRTLRVEALLAERPGLQRVRLDDGSRAYALTQLTGPVAVGDEVVVNTTAVDLGLGTGGWHVVHWNLACRELHQPGPGHIMKIRYTSLQVDTGAAEEDIGDLALPHLGGVPVLVGSLHSQVGVAAAVLKALRPETRVSYVMTDGAALPIALSDLVADLRVRALLDGTVTAGHAFGGDLEAVSVAAALQLAVQRQRAEVVVVAMGPGVVGTASALGTTSVEVAAIVGAAAQLGARPVVIARASSGDARPRHRGMSHHTVTALALTTTTVPVPVPAGSEIAMSVPRPHEAIEVVVPDIEPLLASFGLAVTTMGRGPNEDRLFFDTTAAAAVTAVNMLGSNGTVTAE